MASADANVKVIERALNMLNCFSKERPSLSLVEIAKEIDLPASTTSRILTTLENYDYLHRDSETQRYFLGPNIARLGALSFEQVDYRRLALPYMHEIRERYNESVGLYAPSQGVRVCIEHLNSTHPLKRMFNVGDRLPLTRGASGRLLLAYQPENVVDELLAIDPYIDKEHLANLRELGYSTSRSEREEGVVSAAAPIFNAMGDVVAALNISGPSARIDMDRMEELAQCAKHYAAIISSEMGY